MRPKLIGQKLLAFLLILLSSCEEILFEEDISSVQITVLAPVDESVLAQSPSSLSWGRVDDVLTYDVQIVSPSFEAASNLVLDTVINQSVNTVIRLDLEQLFDGEYEWRIIGRNNNYETLSTVSSFRIGSPIN